jgi:hypothetical protein
VQRDYARLAWNPALSDVRQQVMRHCGGRGCQ